MEDVFISKDGLVKMHSNEIEAYLNHYDEELHEWLRWGYDIKCPYCGNKKYYTKNSRSKYRCASRSCGRAFNVYTNTPLENNKLGAFCLWWCMHCVVNEKDPANTLVADEVISKKSLFYMQKRLEFLKGRKYKSEFDMLRFALRYNDKGIKHRNVLCEQIAKLVTF